MTPLSEPWRLCCPDCGGHSLRSHEGYWRCYTCKTVQEQLKDKKTGRLLSQSEVTA